jgi:hypothetical protein
MKFFKDPFRSPEHLPLDLVALALLVVLGLAGLWTLRGIQKEVNERLAESLEIILQTAHKALRNWSEPLLVDVAALAESDELRRTSRHSFEHHAIPRRANQGAGLQNIRRLFSPAMRAARHFACFSVIAPDGIQLASAYEAHVGLREIVDANPEFCRLL